MNNYPKTGVILLVFAVGLMSGCANIKDDATRTKTEGAGTGAAVGAVVGGVLGQVFGGDTKSTLMGAGVGAVVGGAGGYVYGNHVANQKSKFAKEEDWLNACIADAKKSNKEMVAYNEQLTRQITSLKKETKTIKKRYKTAKSRQEKLQKQQAEVRALHTEARNAVAARKEELKAQKKVVAEAKKEKKGDYAESLDNELDRMKGNIKELEKRTEELASLSASMSV